MLNIVLVAPEIPQNTGAIGRLCVCTDTRLHLIKPLGFSLDESKLKRAGMDYWKFIDLNVYENWDEFLEKNPDDRLFFCTTKTEKTIYGIEFQDEDYLVFGNEGSGLPEDFYREFREQLCTIPMPGKFKRSHNLANSVSIVLYEALRQANNWC